MGLQVLRGFGCVGFTAPVGVEALIGAFFFMPKYTYLLDKKQWASIDFLLS
jgi:hypothetical protein